MRALSVSRSSRSAAGVFALALALWLASTLGLVHRTVHFQGAQASAPVSAAQLAAPGAAPTAARPQGLAALFGIHSDAECRLYDQLSHGSAAPALPLVVLPVLLPAASFAWFEGVVIARRVAHFDARGPPSTR